MTHTAHHHCGHRQWVSNLGVGKALRKGVRLPDWPVMWSRPAPSWR